MSKQATLTEKIRRVSKTEIFRRPSKANTQERSSLIEAEARPLSPLGRYASVPADILFALPIEVLAQILEYVAFADLCTLRRTCSHARSLVNEGEIARVWVNSHVSGHQLYFQPPPSPMTFDYILEQRRRHIEASTTAAVLVDYIEHEILLHTLRRPSGPNAYFDSVMAGLRAKMIPLLLTIQHYLESLARAILSRTAAQVNEIYAELPSISDQIFPTIPVSHLEQSHKCWMFLAWLSNQILSRPSYAGTLERTMRGWLSNACDEYDFRLFFVFGNVGAIKRLVELPSYKHRRRAVETWKRSLDPDQNIHWSEQWQAVSRKSGESLTAKQASAVLSLRLDVRDIWVDGAARALIRSGQMTEDQVWVAGAQIGSPWQTTVRIGVLCGFGKFSTDEYLRAFFAI